MSKFTSGNTTLMNAKFFLFTVFLSICIFFRFNLSLAQTVCAGACTNPGAELVLNGNFNSVMPNSIYNSSAPFYLPAWSSTIPISFGEYYITADASLRNPQWSGVDHTSGTGNFLVCDGVNGQQTSAWGQDINISSYAPNTDFVFTLWVNNAVWPIGNYADPAIQLRVNGVLMLPNSVIIPELPDSWIQLSTSWNSGAAPPAMVTIEVVSTASDGLGNDFSIDDISFRACVPATLTINAGNDLTICKGDIIPLNVVSNGTAFSWIPSSGLSQINIMNPLASPDSTTTYIVTTTNGGCVNTDTITIFVNTISVAQFNVNTQPCSSTVAFTNLSAFALQSQWIFGDGDTSTINNPIHTYNGAGIYSVSLLATGLCGNGVSTQQVIINTGTQPVAQFNYSYSGCTLDVQFTSQATSSNSFAWNFGDGTNDTTMSPSHTFAAPGQFPVSLIVTDSCGIFSDTSIQIINLPDYNLSPSFTWMQDSCTNQILFSNSSPYSATWFWDFGDGFTDTLFSEIHDYIVPGNYNVTLTATNVCNTADTVITVIFIPVVVNLPSMQMEIDNCDNNLTYYNSSFNSNDQQWYFGDGTFSTSFSGTHHYSQPGDYLVSLIINENVGCTSKLDTIIFLTNIFNGIYIPNAFTPNDDGKNDILRIYNNELCDINELTIYNRWGNLVFQNSGFQISWDGKKDGKKVPEDVYFYKLTSGKKQYTGSVLVLY